MSERKVAIKVKNVSKTYRQYKNNMQKIQFLLLKRDVGIKEPVLKKVSFEIMEGEKVGIIGQERSGKSTLMRILGGIIRPDSGKVTVEGSVLPIMDVRLGFDAAMSGKDNYVVMSTALGRSSDVIKAHEDSVFEFAKLTDMKDEQVRNYPKGAPGRLGFATATEIGSDIILYDAGFAFGSNAWNLACRNRMKELISGDVTFVMTVKKVADASELCERGIVLRDGTVAFDGSFKDAVEYYKKTRKKSHGKAAKAEDVNAEAVNAEDETTEEEERIEEQDED